MGEENLGCEEYDDDLFYLELRRWILVMVDDDEDLLESNCKKEHSRICTTTRSLPMGMQQNGNGYLSNWELENTSQAPIWMVNLWRNGNGGNGTGVFIPQVVKSRRRRRLGRKHKSGRRMNTKEMEMV